MCVCSYVYDGERGRDEVPGINGQKVSLCVRRPGGREGRRHRLSSVEVECHSTAWPDLYITTGGGVSQLHSSSPS